MKLDLVPSIDNSLMKLLSGRNYEGQQELLTTNPGFSLTNALAQQIVQMDSGDQVKFNFSAKLEFFSRNLVY